MNRLLAWFAGNGVAANLLLALVVVAGLLALPRIEQEIFPEASLGVVTVTVEHEGAAPDEIESGLCVPVEEAIHAIPGVRRIGSTATRAPRGRQFAICALPAHKKNGIF